MTASAEERVYRIVLEVWSQHPFYREISHGAARYFSEKESWADFSKAVHYEPEAMDGAVVAVSTESARGEWEKRRGTIVNFSNALPSPGFASVVSDDIAVGRLAAEYLHGKGYRRFIYFYNNKGHYAHERGQGFRAWLDEAGFEVQVIQSANRFREALPNLRKPAALFAAEDQPGLQAISFGRQAGLSIPEDLAVLGTNNDAVSCLLGKPPLSSVVIDTFGIGYRAAQLLDELLQGHERMAGPLRVPPLRVEERRSTSSVGFENPLISRIATLMLSNIRDPLNLPQIALRAGLSVKTIQRVFAKELATTPRQFFQQQRIEYAQRLLRTSDVSIAEIADRCGYAEYTKFSRAFRRDVGLSPGAWRKQHRALGTKEPPGPPP